ncbi:hypothetical protein DFH06DRAFT_973756 [Mycena polygramma]|nr:hypothetical protein DFH06DRAFT_973756 [Mycena polygramma]
MLGLTLAVTPPNPAPSGGQQLASTSFEVVLRRREGPVLVKCLCWVIALVEITVITASHSPDWPYSQQIIALLVVGNGNVNRICVSPLFIFGISLTIFGAAIRYSCYRELGQFFTFEVSIHDDHKLVQTGPYHTVRHPGYLGVLLTVAGVFCWNACSGSWLRECGALETTMGLSVVLICTALVVCIAIGLLLRISKEDEALEQHFGEDWVQWSMEVPYKLVPGLF